MVRKLLVFKRHASNRIKDSICKMEAEVLEGKVLLKEDIMLRFDCCQVVG